MSPPHITVGERRGLIALLILLVAATGLLCWRDRSLSHATDQITHDCAESPAAHIDTLLDIPSKADSSTVTRRRRRKADGSKQPVDRPVPQRSPRDERID